MEQPPRSHKIRTKTVTRQRVEPHPVYISSTSTLLRVFKQLQTPTALSGTDPLTFFTISQILLCTTGAEVVKIGLALVDALNSYLLRKGDYCAIENEIPDMR
jgi:hypothetical protein